MAQNELSELMQAANTAPVEGTNFYKEVNEATVAMAAAAFRNTPEDQITAQNKKAAIEQERNTLSLDLVMRAREKDLQAHAAYEAEYTPRSEDYDMLQANRRENLRKLTEEETDPTKNNIFLHPIKTIVSVFKSGQIKDQNRAIVSEMNALSDEMAFATKDYLATQQYNKEELAFNLQTQVNLKSENAMIAARQAEQSAKLRYEDKQDDITRGAQAAAALRAVDPETAAGVGAKSVPTDAELAFYKANKLGLETLPVITDADRPNLIRSLKSEGEDVQAAVAQGTVRYTGYIAEGKGSTETPQSFTNREIVSSANGVYAKGLDKLVQNQYGEIADIGTQLRIERIAAAVRSQDLSGLSPAEQKNPALAKIMGDSKNFADETALQLQVKGALESDFSNNLEAGMQYIQEDMANAVSNRTVLDKRPYVDPGALSAALSNSHFLLSNVPQQYLAGKDIVALKAEADVVAKSTGMAGGDLATHKISAANEYLKKLGVTSAADRVSTIHKWLQQSVMDNYAQRGAYANLTGLTKLAKTSRGEEFIIPLVTRESKRSGLFGKYTPTLPSLDLSSPAGLATYIELAEKGVIEQARQEELQAKQTEKFKTMGGPFGTN